jgi:hypothetical protein
VPSEVERKPWTKSEGVWEIFENRGKKWKNCGGKKKNSSDRDIELPVVQVLETGNRPMPLTLPLKRLSEGGLAQPWRQLHNLLDSGRITWIQ